METKQRTKIALLAGISLGVIVLAALGVLLSTTVFAQPAASQAPPAAPFAAAAEPAEAQKQKSEAVFTAQAGDTAMQLSRVSLSDGQLTFRLCFEVPFESDWAADQMVLVAGGREIRDNYAGMLIEGMAEVEGRAMQCSLNRFQLPAGVTASKMQLIVERIANSAAEQPDCAAAQEKLDAAGAGIKFTCRHEEWSFGYDILEKPADMSELEARRVVSDSFHEVISGPWVFDVEAAN
ncbi:MAG: hypothetical protein ROW48_06500 [Bellilinea sp.]|jgi:hypothetical protein